MHLTGTFLRLIQKSSPQVKLAALAASKMLLDLWMPPTLQAKVAREGPARLP